MLISVATVYLFCFAFLNEKITAIKWIHIKNLEKIFCLILNFKRNDKTKAVLWQRTIATGNYLLLVGNVCKYAFMKAGKC